jgi:hypothetical protein
MKHKSIFILILINTFVVGLCHAQDERFFRDIFTNRLKDKSDGVFVPKDKIKVKTGSYQLDLNDDGIYENLVMSKRDNQNYFQILNFRGQKIYETYLQATGIDAGVYKIQWSAITKDSRVLILHFYEGYTQSTRFEGIARLYFVTIDNKKLSTLKATKGPAFFHEYEKERESYWRRFFHVNVLDYNKDGSREISVNFKSISSIYTYKGSGNWKKL